MQWDSSKNAGFTGGTPWLPVNENYTDINAASEEKTPGSVLLWYRTLAKLRAELPALTEGDFEMLLPDDENIFAFRRSTKKQDVVILVNFTDKDQKYNADLTDGMELAADIVATVAFESENGVFFEINGPLYCRCITNVNLQGCWAGWANF